MPAQSVCIVGAGYSGSALALCLLRTCPPDTTVTLIERSGSFGPGLAFAPCSGGMLLNVPAARMGACAEAPQDFLRWLRARDPAAADGGFAPRAAYGAYLAESLAAAAADKRLTLLHDRATAVQETGDGATVALASGHTLSAGAVVLATGNQPPLPPFDTAPLQQAGAWRADPWAPDAFAGLPQTEPVLLIGTGLTAADAVLTLLGRGHTGPVHAVSRRGLLPCAHPPAPLPPAPPALPLPKGLSALTRQVRREIAQQGAWQPVIDGLRPHTQAIWQGLDRDEKARFLRHLRPYWDVRRHRMAPEVAAAIEAARASGQLTVHAARIVAATGQGVRVRRRATGQETEIRAARVINCTGPAADPARAADPLLQGLLAQGSIRPDPLRLGLDVTADGNCVRADGTVSAALRAIGPLTKGLLWEVTSVPDIRVQAAAVAAALARRAQAATPAAAAA